jgi:Ca2+-binding EF-hand superfamily protein
MRRVLALAACAALPLALQLTLEAQSRFRPAPQQNTEMRFRAMDGNNDGVVTRAEWRGSAQSFAEHDWNDDGVLSGDEVRIGVSRNTRRIEDNDFDPASDRFFSWTDANFTTIDRDRNGRISAREWQYDYESFRRSDRNGDGALTRAEFLGNNTVDDDRDDRFEYLDGNRDGRIERSEWHGSGQTFEWLDKNRDNVLSSAEIAGTQAPNRASADRFSRLDSDGNGRIQVNEWQFSRRSFDQRDTNRDGFLTRNEFGADPTADVGRPVATSGQPAATSGQIVRVEAKQPWTDTGLDVQAGARITFDAEGTMELSENGTDSATPAGARSGRKAPNAPLREEIAGGLIARIGDSAPLFIGSRRTIQRAPVSGRLYLGVNDDHVLDNTGEYRVSVTIQQR